PAPLRVRTGLWACGEIDAAFGERGAHFAPPAVASAARRSARFRGGAVGGGARPVASGRRLALDALDDGFRSAALRGALGPSSPVAARGGPRGGERGGVRAEARRRARP